MTMPKYPYIRISEKDKANVGRIIFLGDLQFKKIDH